MSPSEVTKLTRLSAFSFPLQGLFSNLTTSKRITRKKRMNNTLRLTKKEFLIPKLVSSLPELKKKKLCSESLPTPDSKRRVGNSPTHLCSKGSNWEWQYLGMTIIQNDINSVE